MQRKMFFQFITYHQDMNYLDEIKIASKIADRKTNSLMLIISCIFAPENDYTSLSLCADIILL